MAAGSGPVGLRDSSSPVDSEVIAKGAAHFTAGQYAEALALVDDALTRTPDDATLLFARGSTLFAWGRFYEALQSLQHAREAGMGDLDLHIQLGWTCFNLQRLTEAEMHFRNAVAAEPDSEEAYVALANVLETRGTLSAQAAEFEEGLSRWPENYNAVMLLGACRFHKGDRAGGTSTFRQAISIDPTRSQAWSNLGVALGHDERFEEGLEALRRAFEIDAANGSSENVLNFATVLREDDRHAEALNLLERDLAGNPDPREHWLRSVLLLEAGRFTEGWAEHEFRWMKEPLVSSRWALRRPVWEGQDLSGKTILLHAEQGFGDAIQFIRYARLLKDRGARVVFAAFNDFPEISRDFDDVDEVRVDGSVLDFDFHIPLLSLPRVLGTTLASIPSHVPYVKARASYLERWSQRIQSTQKLKVGLVWAGNPKHVRDRMRSLQLAQLTSLGRIADLQLYSLQKSATAADEIAASGLDLVDLGQHFDNFCDTAAAIHLLDLVISVDTSVAHLAGALGKPVWLMIPKPADWRWLLEGDRTPWYPTMRLFRQPERNRWDCVVENIESSLRELASSRDRTMLTRMHDIAPAGGPIGTTARVEPYRVNDQARLCDVNETRYGIVQYPPQGAMAESLRHYGEYRHAEIELMARFIKPGAFVLEADCGAGVVSLFLAAAVGETGHVIAYEDDRLLHQLARQNLSANRVGNVTLLERRLGTAPPLSSSRGNGASDPIACRADSIDGLRLTRLDSIRINWGSSASCILTGGSETLWRLRPWLFIAVEGEGQTRGLARVARDHGYQCWRFCAPLFNPENYNCRADDVFVEQNAHGLVCIPEEVDMDVDLKGCTQL